MSTYFFPGDESNDPILQEKFLSRIYDSILSEEKLLLLEFSHVNAYTAS